MVSLNERISAEIENVEISLGNLSKALGKSPKTVIELAAIATFLHNIYNGIENILKQTLKDQGREIAAGQSWHRELLLASVEKGIIAEALCGELFKYLGFRHFFVHSYGFMLQEDKVIVLAEDIPNIWKSFKAMIAKE
ncbi:MAG: hypothetical protein PHW04_15575 [Candidatus Wallbacteria bacterium]|nr:hypothetical protein [Candidatus Wallbacteria bacterium]